MKKISLVLASVFALTFAVSHVAVSQTSMIDGEVTKIDESTGKIALRHGPIKKFDMEDGNDDGVASKN